MTTPSELTVITRPKDLCSYVLTVTQKSPKAFRFTITSRLQNLALDVVEQLIRANEVFASKGDSMALGQRLGYQRGATRVSSSSYIWRSSPWSRVASS